MAITQIFEFLYYFMLIPLREMVMPIITFLSRDLGEALNIAYLDGVTVGAILFAEGFFFVVIANIIKTFNPLS